MYPAQGSTAIVAEISAPRITSGQESQVKWFLQTPSIIAKIDTEATPEVKNAEILQKNSPHTLKFEQATKDNRKTLILSYSLKAPKSGVVEIGALKLHLEIFTDIHIIPHRKKENLVLLSKDLHVQVNE